MNSVFLTGRLTRDPELEKSADGQTSYCRFSIAVNRGKNKKGETVTDFPSITAFGKTAENMKRYLEKGCMIAVSAEVHTNKYEKDGKLNYREDLIANRIEFIEWKKTEEETGVVQKPADVETNAETNSMITDDDTPF